jgi:hypothetical protein
VSLPTKERSKGANLAIPTALFSRNAAVQGVHQACNEENLLFTVGNLPLPTNSATLVITRLTLRNWCNDHLPGTISHQGWVHSLPHKIPYLPIQQVVQVYEMAELAGVADPLISYIQPTNSLFPYLPMTLYCYLITYCSHSLHRMCPIGAFCHPVPA